MKLQFERRRVNSEKVTFGVGIDGEYCGELDIDQVKWRMLLAKLHEARLKVEIKDRIGGVERGKA